MAQTTIILSILALMLVLVNAKTTGKHLDGLKSGAKQLLQAAPDLRCLHPRGHD